MVVRIITVFILCLMLSCDVGYFEKGVEYKRIYTTDPNTFYTKNAVIHIPAQRWDEFVPTPKTVYAHAVMLHERYHASRQRRLGFALYAYKYSHDRDFRWGEERTAFRRELSYRFDHGHKIPFSSILATLLHPKYKGMVSKEEATLWLAELGYWSPEEIVR